MNDSNDDYQKQDYLKSKEMKRFINNSRDTETEKYKRSNNEINIEIYKFILFGNNCGYNIYALARNSPTAMILQIMLLHNRLIILLNNNITGDGYI